MIDSVEFTRLWTKAEPMVAAYVNALVPDFHQAEDILQDVAVDLLRKRHRYDRSRPFTPWAIGMAKLVVLERRRAHARGPLRISGDLAGAVAGTYREMLPELEERSAALRYCLGLLRGRTREVVRLRYQEALSTTAIAECLGTTGVTVRVALNRARSALQDCVMRKLGMQEQHP